LIHSIYLQRPILVLVLRVFLVSLYAVNFL